MRSNRQSRSAAAFVCAALFSFVLAACSAGGGSGAGSPVPPAGGPAPNSAKSIAFSSAGTAQALPQVGGITSSIVLPQNNAPSGAQLDVAVSTSPTQATPRIPAGQPQALVYFAMTPSADVTLNGSPKVAVTLPAAPSSQGQFYAWLYDTANKTWLDLAPVTVQGTQITFGGTSKTLTLKRGVQYLAIPFTAIANASCPTPVPSPTPTPFPFTGKFFLAGNTVGSNNADVDGNVLTYSEATGQQLSTLSLGYPTGTILFSATLSNNGNLLYVTAGTANNSGGNANASGTPVPALSIVDTATNTVLHQTTIPGNIFAGALSADQTRFYGAGYDGTKSAFVVFVFDAATGAELASIPLPSGAQYAGQIVIDNSTDAAYVLGSSDNVYKVDLASGTASVLYHESVSSDQFLQNIALDPAESKLYLAESPRVLELDPATGSVLGTITLPSGVSSVKSMGQSADRKTLLLVESLNQSPYNGASVVSAATGSIVKSFTLAQSWVNSSLNANGTYALLAYYGYSTYGQPQLPAPGAFALPSGTQLYTVAEPLNIWVEATAAQ